MKKITLLLIAVLVTVSFISTAQTWQHTTCPHGGTISSITSYGNNIFVGTTLGGIQRSTDDGVSWATVNNGLTDLHVYAITVHGNAVFAGTLSAGIFKSTDNGDTWIPVNNGIALGYNAIWSLVSNGNTIYAGTGNNMFLSNDNGNTWIPINNGLFFPNTQCILVDGNDIYRGISVGGQYGGIFKSSDNGASWTPMNTGLTNLLINCFAVSGTNLFAGTQDGLFISTNGGATWNPINNGLDCTNISSLIAYGNTIYAGTANGTEFGFVSYDNGNNWVSLNDNSNSLSSALTAYHIKGNTLYAGLCCGHGLWKQTLPETPTGIEEDKSKSNNFTVYPNPASDFQKIAYNTDKAGRVELNIYDLLGNKVAVIVNTFQDAGQFTSTFDTNGLSSGIYTVSMVTDNGESTQKVVVQH